MGFRLKRPREAREETFEVADKRQDSDTTIRRGDNRPKTCRKTVQRSHIVYSLHIPFQKQHLIYKKFETIRQFSGNPPEVPPTRFFSPS